MRSRRRELLRCDKTRGLLAVRSRDLWHTCLGWDTSDTWLGAPGCWSPCCLLPLSLNPNFMISATKNIIRFCFIESTLDTKVRLALEVYCQPNFQHCKLGIDAGCLIILHCPITVPSTWLIYDVYKPKWHISCLTQDTIRLWPGVGQKNSASKSIGSIFFWIPHDLLLCARSELCANDYWSCGA